MSQEQQLAALKNALETQKRVSEIEAENNKLRDKISRKQDTLDRLSKLTISATALLGSVDSSSKETEISSVKCLSKIENSSAVSEEDLKEEEDPVKAVVGKYLNEVLSVIARISAQVENEVDIFSMEELEITLGKLFEYAEQRQIIPTTKDGQGWKQSLYKHQAIFEQIHNIMGQQQQPTSDEK